MRVEAALAAQRAREPCPLRIEERAAIARKEKERA